MENKLCGGNSLPFSILDHFLVPKHETLTKEKAQEAMKALGLTEESMPKILGSDPVVEEIGAKKGDVIKITRKSPTAGESIYYRIVV
jgi:DNA-directed RNA polymerase subunit H